MGCSGVFPGRSDIYVGRVTASSCHTRGLCAGYCSLAHFIEGDLGTPLAPDKVPAHIQPLMKAASKTAAPVTPEQSAPAKASRKSLPPETPGGAAKPRQPASTQGISASQVFLQSFYFSNPVDKPHIDC